VCLCVLIKHLESFSLTSSLRHPFLHFTDRLHMLLNANTVTNLEIFRNSTDGTERGSLFSIIDRTKTRFGRRLLKSWVGRPLINVAYVILIIILLPNPVCLNPTIYSALQERQAAVQEIVGSKQHVLGKLRGLLNGLPDLEKVWILRFT
jgi:DNA mismatch repair protein MSH3